MRRIAPLTLLVAGILLTGCATGTQSAASSPTPVKSATSTPAPVPTPTPTPEPVVTLDPESEEPAVEPVAPAEPPASVVPNTVDPSDYVSTAIDYVNGGVPLPGVAFTVADGRITCGILTWGHAGTAAGFVSCTPDTYREIYPQPTPEGPLYVMSIESDPNYGPAGLYPDWFKQPERSVPVLPEGKNIRYEGTTCSAEGGGVKCTHDANGKGFFLTLESYTYFT
jgi:hypothetical protein